MRVPISQEKINEYLKEIQSLKSGFDLLSNHLVITDENANIVYANKAVEKNTGFSLEEIIGKNPADLWGGKMPKKFYEEMWHRIKIEKQPFTGEIQNVRKDGTTYWQELLITPLLDEKNEVKFFIGIEPNITDRKKRDEFKEQFISAIGHQTRNPLITIRWILEELLSRTTLGDTDRKKLEEVYGVNKTLTDLVKDLLIVSHVENLALQFEIVRLDEEINNAIQAVQKKYPNILITFENNADSAQVYVVRSLVVQIFLNIIYNAAEHANKESGEVSVKIGKIQQGLLFSCHNNGDPIPEDIKPRIFTKVTSTGGGAGLGLFIVKIICDYFGWHVWFETGEEGTNFFVKMPFPNQ